MINNYIETLKKEIEFTKKDILNYYVSTIYFGGGTPSYIESNCIKEILNTIFKNYNVNNEVEITIEVNPRYS